MSRAPIAYALGRPLDSDAGGAADLQTDIMRFMAILALCLMAIFALVQSLPNTQAEAPPAAVETASATPASEPAAAPPETSPMPALTRPQQAEQDRQTETPAPLVVQRADIVPPAPAPAEPDRAAPPEAVQVTTPEPEGFTLRFESDTALSRLVAMGKVGLFAIDGQGAQRMSVAESRITFWAAPLPARYHEMDAATVPAAVSDALQRTGRAGDVHHWAVTLPSRLSGELQRLMQSHRGGALVIARDGSLRREPT